MNFADQTAEIPKKQMQLQLREVSVALYLLVVHQLLKNIEHMQKKKNLSLSLISTVTNYYNYPMASVNKPLANAKIGISQYQLSTTLIAMI